MNKKLEDERKRQNSMYIRQQLRDAPLIKLNHGTEDLQSRVESLTQKSESYAHSREKSLAEVKKKQKIRQDSLDKNQDNNKLENNENVEEGEIINDNSDLVSYQEKQMDNNTKKVEIFNVEEESSYRNIQNNNSSKRINVISKTENSQINGDEEAKNISTLSHENPESHHQESHQHHHYHEDPLNNPEANRDVFDNNYAVSYTHLTLPTILLV